eukprot:7377320-Prymnesium_polylepis.1
MEPVELSDEEVEYASEEGGDGENIPGLMDNRQARSSSSGGRRDSSHMQRRDLGGGSASGAGEVLSDADPESDKDVSGTTLSSDDACIEGSSPRTGIYGSDMTHASTSTLPVAYSEIASRFAARDLEYMGPTKEMTSFNLQSGVFCRGQTQYAKFDEKASDLSAFGSGQNAVDSVRFSIAAD